MRITENNFIAELRRGNEKALEYMAEHYGGLMYAVVRKQLASLPELQQECMNDALLAVWQHISRYDENRSSFENWLAGICRYKAIDCRRRWLHQIQEAPLESAEHLEDAGSRSVLLEQEIFEETEQMLSCLNEDDRALFRQLFIDGVSAEEAAIQRGISRSNVYNRVSRGRKRIQKQYPAFGKEQKR
ncbi:MAG: sigma-70 family RNA polymerase sigma factor [Peptococcaceae bacterium]|nr:sigma-70 family RNA polymerase sigma factor [Peptococcaceae bacterium]